jgi:hypothetical protein
LEDGSDCLSLRSIDRDFPVLGVVAKWRHSTDPEALAFGSGDLVSDPLGSNLAFELGKGQQDVQDQPPHRGRRIELLGAQSSADPKRPFLWGPAAAGEAGVDSPIRILREELDTAMVLLGARCFADIPADLLRAEPLLIRSVLVFWHQSGREYFIMIIRTLAV